MERSTKDRAAAGNPYVLHVDPKMGFPGFSISFFVFTVLEGKPVVTHHLNPLFLFTRYSWRENRVYNLTISCGNVPSATRFASDVVTYGFLNAIVQCPNSTLSSTRRLGLVVAPKFPASCAASLGAHPSHRMYAPQFFKSSTQHLPSSPIATKWLNPISDVHEFSEPTGLNPPSSPISKGEIWRNPHITRELHRNPDPDILLELPWPRTLVALVFRRFAVCFGKWSIHRGFT